MVVFLSVIGFRRLAACGPMSGPAEVVRSSAEFEVAFDDAEVDFEIGADECETGAGGDAAVGKEFEFKLLHVHGRGCEHGGFHAAAEPVGDFLRRGFAEGFEGFLRMLYALVGAVAEGDDAEHSLAVGDGVAAGLFAEGEADPAGVEAEGLGEEDDALGAVAEEFVLAAAADEGDVVVHAAEFAVFGEAVGEGFGLVGDELEAEAAVGIGLCDGGLEAVEFFFFDGFIEVLAHGMACKNGFLEGHGEIFKIEN